MSFAVVMWDVFVLKAGIVLVRVVVAVRVEWRVVVLLECSGS